MSEHFTERLGNSVQKCLQDNSSSILPLSGNFPDIDPIKNYYSYLKQKMYEPIIKIEIIIELIF